MEDSNTHVFDHAKHIHFVGIKGVGMAALAIYFKEKGIKITGSDVTDVFPTDHELTKKGITILEGFNPEDIAGKHAPDVVIYTGAHGGWDNPVVSAATRSGIPAIAHGKALGAVMNGKRQIVVAGSHGKTTTSAMISSILLHARVDASYAVGCGGISGLGAAGHFGRSEWFVAEGDEYVTDPGRDATPRFLWMKPEILVVTNIDFDHPDVYANISAVQEAFRKLIGEQVGQQLTVVNIDDSASRPLLSGKNVLTYGFSPRADMHIQHAGAGAERMFFVVEYRGVVLGEFSLNVPGRHNVANATAAMIAANACGLDWATIRKGLLSFGGTTRRFEKVGEARNSLFYDDYAHHPHEIEATLAAAKLWFPGRRIIAVFQPHTYSRTRALLSQFARAFGGAHTVVITDIYASAREHDTLGMNGQTLVDEVAKHHASVFYAKDQDAVYASLAKRIQPESVVMFMGAGDIYAWEKDIIKQLSNKQ